MIKRTKTAILAFMLICLAQMTCVSLGGAMKDAEYDQRDDQFGNLDDVSTDAIPSYFWLLANLHADENRDVDAREDDLMSVGWESTDDDYSYDENGSDTGFDTDAESDASGPVGLWPAAGMGLRVAFDRDAIDHIRAQRHDSTHEHNDACDADQSKSDLLEQDDNTKSESSWLTNPVPYCALAVIGVAYYYRHSIAQWFGFADTKKKDEKQQSEDNSSELADNVVEN